MAKDRITPESTSEGNQIAVTVTEKGPYLVTGNPPLAMQFIMPDSEGRVGIFRKGGIFRRKKNRRHCAVAVYPAANPIATATHLKEEWDSAITSGEDRIMDEVEITEGQRVTLNDNEKYCVFARFCHPYGRCLGPDGRIRRFAVPQAGRPRSFDVSERPPDRLGQPHGKTLRIHLRTQPGIDRRPGDRRQRRTLGTRRDPHPTRRRPNLRSSEQGSALPLRTLPQQALLRRCACRRQMERRAGGNPQWRNAPPKRCQCENRNPLTGLPFHSNKIGSTGTLYSWPGPSYFGPESRTLHSRIRSDRFPAISIKETR